MARLSAILELRLAKIPIAVGNVPRASSRCSCEGSEEWMHKVDTNKTMNSKKWSLMLARRAPNAGHTEDGLSTCDAYRSDEGSQTR